jgi:structural maintenance of chromosome 1
MCCVRERSSEFQCVVISLKDMFFEHANALVGICRDRAANGSKTLTLDLDQYDTQQPEDDDDDEEGQ